MSRRDGQPRWLDRLVSVTKERTGIALTEDQIRRLVGFIEERTRVLGQRTPDDYVRALYGEKLQEGDWPAYLAVLTNRQTYFYRDVEQFAALGEVLTRLAWAHPRRQVTIWSAACSTGEEPYSLAMLCLSLGVDARVLATDINPAVLERAEGGTYAPWALRNLEERQKELYFVPDGECFRVREEVKQMVSFARANLASERIPRPDRGIEWDLILCRNVFIYFSRDTVAAVCRRIATVLADHGALALGASETLHGLDVPLAPEVVLGRIFYRVGEPSRALHEVAALEKTLARRAAEPAPELPSAPIAEHDRPLTPPLFIERVVEQVKRGATTDALAACADWLEAAPEDADALLTVGHLHLKAHQFDDALGAYRKASATNPLLAEAYYFEGLTHRKVGAWQHAEAALRRALFLEPALWQASHLLAGVHERLGQSRDAARERRRTERLLASDARCAFRSHPLFVEWFGIDEGAARSALAL